MNALQGMDRYRKELIQVSTWTNDIKVQYLYNTIQFKNYIIFLKRQNLELVIKQYIQ